MDYRKIISVTGMGGLYELVGSKKDGAIVRSLEDKSTKFVSQRIHNFSHLESIEVYTEKDNVNLVDVFIAMQNSSESLPSDKDNAAIKAYFQKVFPQMDFERVYASDMKKMVKWYTILQANNVEIKLSEEAEETEEAVDDTKETIIEEPVVNEVAEVKKPKAKTAKVKAEPKSDEPNTEKKPVAKKSATKKES